MTAGAALAEVIGKFLDQWRRTGYLPPRCEPHPITGAECRRDDCDGAHTYDGQTPWIEAT